MFKSYVIIVKGHELGERFGAKALETGKSNGWNIERYNAVDGRIVTCEDLPKYNLKLHTGYKKQIAAMQRPGVFGNFLTHWQLWNLCVRLNEPIGCFEHDVIFKGPPPEPSFKHLLKLDRLQKQKYYGTGQCWQGAHAYIIKPKGAKRLIGWAQKNGVMGADIMIGDEIINIAFNEDNLIGFNPESHTPEGKALHSTSKSMTF